jgi:hypothetical protein
VKNKLLSLALIAGLAACSGGNPFDDQAETPGETPDGEVIGDGEGTGINRDGIPPGTASPSPGSAIFRSEERVDTGANAGNGYATGITYNNANDTFTVDNLGFDGDQPYSRGAAVSSLSPDARGRGRFAVYDGPATAVDPRSISDANPTGEVRQFVYRAIYGVSENQFRNSDGNLAPTTQFAIVRTGSYVEYGFGGFIYQRDNAVNLPTTGQATFTGQSAGLRDFANASGLQYTTADVTVNIDFSDFNDGTDIRGDAVSGVISNRRVLDLNGDDITAQVAGTLGEDVTRIPDALFVVGPDVLDNNGDLVTEIQSTLPNGNTYENGTFYAIVSGEAD